MIGPEGRSQTIEAALAHGMDEDPRLGRVSTPGHGRRTGAHAVGSISRQP